MLESVNNVIMCMVAVIKQDVECAPLADLSRSWSVKRNTSNRWWYVYGCTEGLHTMHTTVLYDDIVCIDSYTCIAQ